MCSTAICGFTQRLQSTSAILSGSAFFIRIHIVICSGLIVTIVAGGTPLNNRIACNIKMLDNKVITEINESNKRIVIQEIIKEMIE